MSKKNIDCSCNALNHYPIFYNFLKCVYYGLKASMSVKKIKCLLTRKKDLQSMTLYNTLLLIIFESHHPHSLRCGDKFHFALQISFHSFSANVIDSTNSSNLQWPLGYALRFWNLGLIIPIRFTHGIVQLTNSDALRFRNCCFTKKAPPRNAFLTRG